MSHVDQTITILRHNFAIGYGGKPSDDFARNAVVSVGMSAALEAAKGTYAWIENPADVAREREANKGVTPDLAEGLRKLGEMAGMPDIAERHAERAVKSYWGQLTLMAGHRERNAELAQGMRI